MNVMVFENWYDAICHCDELTCDDVLIEHALSIVQK